MLYFQDKKSPLWLAAAGGHKEIVKYFVQQHNCILKEEDCVCYKTSYFLIPYCRRRFTTLRLLNVILVVLLNQIKLKGPNSVPVCKATTFETTKNSYRRSIQEMISIYMPWGTNIDPICHEIMQNLFMYDYTTVLLRFQRFVMERFHH